MRIIKLSLITLLVLVGLLFVVDTAATRIRGVNQGPEIRCEEGELSVSVLDGEDVLRDGVSAWDAQDGDLSQKIHIQGVSKLLTENTAKISYIVFDSHGNFSVASRMIRYTDYSRPGFQVVQPLIYRESEQIRLLDRVKAADALDGDITQSIRVSALQATSDPDVWTAGVQVTNSMGDTARLELPIIIHTGLVVRPEVKLTEYLIYLDRDAPFRAEDYLSGVDTPIGPGEKADVIITGPVDTSAVGTYYVYYRYPYSITAGLSVLTVVVR